MGNEAEISTPMSGYFSLVILLVNHICPLLATHSTLQTYMYRSTNSEDVQCPETAERAVMLILPNKFDDCEDILRDLIQYQFSIVQKKEVQLSHNEIMQWQSLSTQEGGWDWAERVADASCMAVLLQRANIFFQIDSLTMLLNEEAVRSTGKTGIYISKDSVTAFRDINFFFPSMQTEVDFMKHTREYLNQRVFPILNEKLATLAVERPVDPIKWLADNLKK